MSAEILDLASITTPELVAIFERASFKPSPLSENGFIVENDWPGVAVYLENKVNIIRYVAIMNFKDSVLLGSKLALVNKLNDGTLLVRYSVPEDNNDLLIGDYGIPIDTGITKSQIISAFRQFIRLVPKAIISCEERYLIK